jgi:2-polyprenyl-6-methoxyphenol hydroxylase-like FAD-dependent oxidoreductase
VAGLAAALSLARSDRRVILLERDTLETRGGPQCSFDWKRKGIPHFQQPHAFLPRGRRELKELFPDVFDALIKAGASDYSIAVKLRGKRLPEDDDLVYLSVRRPVIEWALREAVLRETNVEVRSGVRVRDLLIEQDDLPTIRGVLTDTGVLDADLVIDAQGRTTNFPTKLRDSGFPLTTETSKSHIVYYSRYFQMRSGMEFPRGPWLTTPRADFGFAGCSSFTGDNGTFALVLSAGSWDHDFRILQKERAWDAVARAVPVFSSLVEPTFASPITPVLAMGELQNTLRHYVEAGRPRVRGLIPVGDTVCHTDPTFALGLSFAVLHARALESAIRTCNSDPDSLLVAFWNEIYPEIRERYDLAVAIDDARAGVWRGAKVDAFHADGCYPLFSFLGASIAALRDDDILRKTVRRIGFLDRVSVFDGDRNLHRKIESILQEARVSIPAPPTVSREQLLELAGKATATKSQISTG